MSHPDPELEQIRETIDCATFLERLPRPWQLDRNESTKGSLKYRRGQGEILIVNHDGRGWWDPTSDAKGDIFSLAQHFEPNLNFGQVRKMLRHFTGRRDPDFSARTETEKKASKTSIAIPERWASRPRIIRNSPAWCYLTRDRALPPRIIERAIQEDVVREGPRASAWFAHRNASSAVTHVETRGPEFKGSLKGGVKTLFRFPGGPKLLCRLVLAEAPIDALSLAAIEDIRSDTLYAATGGGMGNSTIAEITQVLELMTRLLHDLDLPILLASATDANKAGDRYASRHEELAGAAGVPFERLRPPIERGDWNDVLKAEPEDQPHTTISSRKVS